MSTCSDYWMAHLLGRLRLVQENLGVPHPVTEDPNTCFADVLDSMGLVEFLTILAEDCGVTPTVLEQCVERRFGTVAELAAALEATGLMPCCGKEAAGRVASSEQRELRGYVPAGPIVPQGQPALTPVGDVLAPRTTTWLAATVACLPDTVQLGAAINAALHRPPGWLESHAGIDARHTWADQDPLAAADRARRACLDRAGLLSEEVGALLVTSEAPPLVTGLAAALHHRFDLRPSTVALEVGGACTGFLAALWLGQALLRRLGVVLVICLEAPTQFLKLQPGPAGEAAALFGDAAAACALCDHPAGREAVPLSAIELGVNGKEGALIRTLYTLEGGFQLHLDGVPLASRAVRVMAESVWDLLRRSGLVLSDLTGIVAHGGNGRLPSMLARRLCLQPARIWSETARTGNLGSASLPVGWAAHSPPPQRPVAWTAVGAGLNWGAALTGSRAAETTLR